MKKENSKNLISQESFQTMRKEEVVDRIFLKTGMPKKEVKIVVENLMNVIEEAIISKKNVSLKGFVNFQIKKQAARRARDIKKENSVFIPSRYKAVGKFSKIILNKLNKLDQD